MTVYCGLFHFEEQNDKESSAELSGLDCQQNPHTQEWNLKWDGQKQATCPYVPNSPRVKPSRRRSPMTKGYKVFDSVRFWTFTWKTDLFHFEAHWLDLNSACWKPLIASCAWTKWSLLGEWFKVNIYRFGDLCTQSRTRIELLNLPGCALCSQTSSLRLCMSRWSQGNRIRPRGACSSCKGLSAPHVEGDVFSIESRTPVSASTQCALPFSGNVTQHHDQIGREKIYHLAIESPHQSFTCDGTVNLGIVVHRVRWEDSTEWWWTL